MNDKKNENKEPKANQQGSFKSKEKTNVVTIVIIEEQFDSAKHVLCATMFDDAFDLYVQDTKITKDELMPCWLGFWIQVHPFM